MKRILKNMSGEPPHQVIVLALSPADTEIVDKWRGELSREDFLLALLRICTSGRVSNPPDWIREGSKADEINGTWR